MIRVTDYLEYIGEDYKPSGKNVGANDVNIDCPFCGETNKHLGIHRTKGTLHCWVCDLEWFQGKNKYPKFVDLIMLLENCSHEQAYNTLNKFSDDFFKEQETEFKKPSETFIPEEIDNFHKPQSIWHRDLALQYLKNRKFGWEEIDKYNLYFCSFGKFAMRIIIPVFVNGNLATFVGRDYANREQESRYKNCSAKLSLKRPTEILYGQDNFVGPHLRLVEGTTDKWRMNDLNTLALFTSKLSRSQRDWIINKLGKIESCSIIFDSDAYFKALTIAEELSIFINKIKVVDINPYKDPDNAGKINVLEIEKMTKWINF
jgi:transcription elongation factor Elf1